MFAQNCYRSTEKQTNMSHSDAEIELDVREIDGEPFGDIMAALEELPTGETLHLINSFEPVPLYDVLEQRGYTHQTEQDGDVWHVFIQEAA